MYCPRCGSQQTTEEMRFCVKCGLQLGVARSLLSSDATDLEREKRNGLSPRTRGVLQGIAIVPASLGAWFALDIFYETVLGAGIMGGVFAMFTLILAVAIGRIVYAFVFEQGHQKSVSVGSASQFAELSAGGATTDRLLDNVVDLRFGARDMEANSVTENTTHRLELEK